jgi:hypothetical protein
MTVKSDMSTRSGRNVWLSATVILVGLAAVVVVLVLALSGGSPHQPSTAARISPITSALGHGARSVGGEPDSTASLRATNTPRIIRIEPTTESAGDEDPSKAGNREADSVKKAARGPSDEERRNAAISPEEARALENSMKPTE